MSDKEPCEVCGRPTGGCCTVPDNEPKKFKVVRLPAPPVETFDMSANVLRLLVAFDRINEEAD